MTSESTKKKYHTVNWKEYNQSLVNRGKITLWIGEEAIKHWVPTRTEKKNGRPFQYSKIAIEAALTLRYAFNLPLRATEGFLISLFTMLQLALSVPSYTLLCKRGKEAPKPRRSKAVTDIVIDSTGVKVFGEGEWKVKQHGKGKKQKWKKFHIGIDPRTGEVIVHETTKSETHDNEVGCRLIKRLEKVENAYGDGAYDTETFYEAVAAKGGQAVVPPRKNAVVNEKLPESSPLIARNNAILEILGLGGHEEARALWKKLKKYHIRSLVETWISRFKRMLGGLLRSRNDGAQESELGYKVKIMNRLTALGMPISRPV